MRDGEGPRPSRFRTVGVALTVGIVALEVAIALGFYAVATVLPQVTRGFGADSAYSVAAAAAMIASVFGLAVAAPWADRVGPRRPFAVGFAGLIAGQLACALAPGIAVFVAGRLLAGLGTGLVGVALYGLISRVVAPEHRPFVFGWLNGSWLLPSLAGPALTGIVAERWGWRTVFWGVAVLMAVGYGVLAHGMRSHDLSEPGPARIRTPWAWATLAAGAMLALHVGGQQATAGAVVVSVLGLALTLVAMVRLLPPGTLQAAPGAPRLVALRGLLAASTLAAEAYVPFYLQHDRGLTMGQSGLVIAATAVGWTAGAYLQAPWARRAGVGTVLRIVAALAVSGPATLLLVVTVTGPVAVIVAALAVMGFAMGAAYPQLSTAAMAATPASEHASVGGALQLAEAAGGGAVLAVTGLVLAFGAGLTWAYVVLSVVGLLAVWAARSAVAGSEGGSA